MDLKKEDNITVRQSVSNLSLIWWSMKWKFDTHEKLYDATKSSDLPTGAITRYTPSMTMWMGVVVVSDILRSLTSIVPRSPGGIGYGLDQVSHIKAKTIRFTSTTLWRNQKVVDSLYSHTKIYNVDPVEKIQIKRQQKEAYDLCTGTITMPQLPFRTSYGRFFFFRKSLCNATFLAPTLAWRPGRG
mgnify:CR=1 FL=1